MNEAAHKITNLLEQHNLIDRENREIYKYGMERLLTYSLNILTTWAIAWFCGLALEGIVFSIAFILMRHYNGGAHAANDVRCYILSTISVLACLYAVKWTARIDISAFGIFLAVIPFMGIVMMLSPVEDYNKPIDELERVVYKRRGMAVLLLCGASILVFMKIGLRSWGCVVGSAIILTSITMVIGRIKNMLIDRKLDKLM